MVKSSKDPSKNSSEQNKNSTENTVEQKATAAATAVSAKFSGPLAPLEKKLNEVLGEKAPYKIPKNGRESLVKLAPWLSLAGGIFGIIGALGLWRAAHRVSEVIDSVNRFSTAFGAPIQKAPTLGLFFWASLVMLVVFSLLALIAFPGLKTQKKTTGWNLMFFSSIASTLYGVASLFYDGGGFSSFIGTIVGTTIGLYLLFQIRSHYK
jgi:hypothetical protein